MAQLLFGTKNYADTMALAQTQAHTYGKLILKTMLTLMVLVMLSTRGTLLMTISTQSVSEEPCMLITSRLDAQIGHITLTDPYNEPITGNYWWGWITLIADDKVYLGTIEHSAEQPMPRGAPQVCLNATDGSVVWRINGMFRNTRWGGNGVIGDSIIATMDTYDQRVYAIGKGPTDISLTVSPVVSTLNSGVQIQGSVTDISSGLSDEAITARFPQGVPAVSDDSQSEWMLFVWKQFEHPTNITGVPVSIDVVDSNGNYRHIGTTTSDGSGHYSLPWTPDILGGYTVIATFEGSKAYYGAHTETSINVASAPSPTATSTSPGTSMVEQWFFPSIIALFIVVIIIGIVLALLIRRK